MYPCCRNPLIVLLVHCSATDRICQNLVTRYAYRCYLFCPKASLSHSEKSLSKSEQRPVFAGLANLHHWSNYTKYRNCNRPTPLHCAVLTRQNSQHNIMHWFVSRFIMKTRFLSLPSIYQEENNQLSCQKYMRPPVVASKTHVLLNPFIFFVRASNFFVIYQIAFLRLVYFRSPHLSPLIVLLHCVPGFIT